MIGFGTVRVMEYRFYQGCVYSESRVSIGHFLGLPIFVVCETYDSGADDALFRKMYTDNLVLVLQDCSVTSRFMVEGTLSLQWPADWGFDSSPSFLRLDVKRYISAERLKVSRM